MKSTHLIMEKYLILLWKIILIGALIFLLCSCESEEEESNTGIEVAENFLTPEAVNALRDMGFPFYGGENPPVIEGTYIAELVLQETSVPNDAATPGMRFPDWKVKFSNQTGTDVFVEEFQDTADTTGEGYGALILGESNLGGTSNFTVLVKQNLIDGTGHNYTSIRAISGDAFLSPEAETIRILDFELATLMLDNNGNPNENLLPNNTGRLFNDENGSADRF